MRSNEAARIWLVAACLILAAAWVIASDVSPGHAGKMSHGGEECVDRGGDADGDLVCDDEDNCPAIPNPNQPHRRKLHGVQPGRDVKSFELTDDGSRVLFVANHDDPDTENLYVAHVEGDPQTLALSGESDGGYIWPYAATPDGLTAVFRVFVPGNPDLLSRYLYSRTIDGSLPAMLIGPPDKQPKSFAISPNGERVAFEGAMTSLYGVPTDGATGPYTLFSDPDRWSVPAYRFLTTGERVVFVFWHCAFFHINDCFEEYEELYSVDSSGATTATLLDSEETLSWPGSTTDFRLTTDGSTMVYRLPDRYWLHRVETAGGPSSMLAYGCSEPGQIDCIREFELTADEDHVVFIGLDSKGHFGLFRASMVGGDSSNPVQLSETMVLGGNLESFKLPSGGTHVVYRADQELNETFELYQVPISGGPVTKLSGPVAGGAGVTSYDITPDGQRVVYAAEGGDGVVELFSVPSGGGAVTQLSSEIEGDGVGGFEISPDGAVVVYESGPLFRVPVAGGPIVALSGAMASPGGSVSDFSISPNSSTVVYLADQDTVGDHELFAVSLDVDADGGDADLDGAGGACDCDENNPYCRLDCTDADADAFCTDLDCDDGNVLCGGSCGNTDRDLACDEFDCLPEDAIAWQVPGETVVEFLNPSILVWTPSDPGGEQDAYDVVRSGSLDFTTSNLCVESGDTGDTQALDLAQPSAGRIFYYVVRAENGCGPGPAGLSNGVPREVADCP